MSAARLARGLAVSLAILVLAFVSMNLLKSWGVWVTLLLVSLLTAAAAGTWAWDTLVRRPDDTGPAPSAGSGGGS